MAFINISSLLLKRKKISPVVSTAKLEQRSEGWLVGIHTVRVSVTVCVFAILTCSLLDIRRRSVRALDGEVETSLQQQHHHQYALPRHLLLFRIAFLWVPCF
jgi:hypothetical protein